MVGMLNTRRVGHLDCADGGQVWVDGLRLTSGICTAHRSLMSPTSCGWRFSRPRWWSGLWQAGNRELTTQALRTRHFDIPVDWAAQKPAPRRSLYVASER